MAPDLRRNDIEEIIPVRFLELGEGIGYGMKARNDSGSREGNGICRRAMGERD